MFADNLDNLLSLMQLYPDKTLAELEATWRRLIAIDGCRMYRVTLGHRLSRLRSLFPDAALLRLRQLRGSP